MNEVEMIRREVSCPGPGKSARVRAGCGVRPVTFVVLAVTALTVLGANAAGESVSASPAPSFREVELEEPSVDGAPIRMLIFNESAAAPFLLFCAIHGDEAESARLCERLETRWKDDPALLGGTHLLFIPVANPDGLKRGTRYNANGIDCNRNFPANFQKDPHRGKEPLSEPETRDLYNLVETRKPYAVISVHSCRSCGGMNNYDGPATAWANAMAAHNGFTASPEWDQKTPGSFGTYAGKFKNIPTVTLELPRGLHKQEDFLKNMLAVEAAITLRH